MAWVPRIGDEFAGYRLESLVGSGGMSIVYRARHLSLDRMVALKLLSPQLSDDESFRERFLRESRLAASLDHPNVIPIYEAGEQDGVFYIAMRFVTGRDLKTLLKQEGPLDGPRAASVISQVAGALAAAHSQGLVHRDVKPANVLIASGIGSDGGDHIYLSDFGVVKHGASQPLTKTGIFVGTADYAAPEQIEGKQLDGRADVYSLGCVLYECLTGAPAYERDSEVALMYAHLLEPPPTVSPRRSDLPPEIDEVLAKGMAKNRDERYATPGELATATREVLAGGASPSSVGAAATVLSGAPPMPPAGTTVAPGVTAPSGTTVQPPPQPPDGGTGAEPPAEGDAEGPPAAPGTRRGVPKAALLGVFALLVAAGIAAAFLLMGGDDEEGTGTTNTTTTSTGPTTEASLISFVVPTQDSQGCTKLSKAKAPAAETYSCTPSENAPTSYPDELELSFFANANDLEQAYEAAKEGVTLTACTSGVIGERVWIHQATGKRGGRRFCALDSDGDFDVVWTHEKLDAADHADTLGIATEPGRSPTLFRSWWNGAKDNIGKCRPLASEQDCNDAIAKLK